MPRNLEENRLSLVCHQRSKDAAFSGVRQKSLVANIKAEVETKLRAMPELGAARSKTLLGLILILWHISAWLGFV